MKKRLLTLAVSGALALPFAAQAQGDMDVAVSGFADIIYTGKNEARDDQGVDGDNDEERKFTADGEINVIAKPTDGVTARIDVDLILQDADGQSDSGEIEQAFFAWGVTPMITLIGGVFNNPLGQDAEDAPNMLFTSHSSIYSIFDNQTALNGNNIAGAGGAIGSGPFSLTAAVLNDIQQVDEENSFAIHGTWNVAQLEGLSFEAGYVTQEDDSGLDNTVTTGRIGAGNVFDINGMWDKIMNTGFGAGFDVLVPKEVIKTAWNVWGGYDFKNGFGIRGRYEKTESDIDAADDSEAFALYGYWQARSNLAVAVEYTKGDADDVPLWNDATGIYDGDRILVEIIAVLGDFK